MRKNDTMSSLASLFKKISQPNPAEIDPEDAYHSIDAKAKESTGIEHDEDIEKIMGTSKLRQQISIGNDSIQQKKYAGRLVNVKDWMDPDTGDRSESDDPSNRGNLKEEKPTDIEEQEKDDESDEQDDSEEYNHEDDEENEQDEGDDEDAKDDEDSTHASTTSTSENQDKARRTGESFKPESTASQSKHAPEQPSDLINHLQSSVKADIEKGKAVKKQLTTYDRILAVRIGIQKPLIATNKLVEINSQTENGAETDAGREQARIAVKHLLEISSKIGALRSELMESIDGEPPRKRKKDQHETDEDPQNDLENCLEQAEQLDKRLSPFLRTTVRKWSTKINSTTALNSKKFDAGSKQQNVMDQLDRTWSSNDERNKLINRSRTHKQGPNRSTLVVTNANSDDDSRPQIFEDRDFYLSLLKEVVETATRNQEETMMGMNDYRSQRTHRGDADPKASKGRKIRYDVHEKLVSLMVPIQNELWTDEQKDELFGSLFGFGFQPLSAPNLDHQPFSLAKSDGFKLL